MIIETLNFPCEVKKKIKMKASLGNLSISYFDGYLIKINNTNLNITESYKIIVKNKITALLAQFFVNMGFVKNISLDSDRCYQEFLDENDKYGNIFNNWTQIK